MCGVPWVPRRSQGLPGIPQCVASPGSLGSPKFSRYPPAHASPDLSRQPDRNPMSPRRCPGTPPKHGGAVAPAVPSHPARPRGDMRRGRCSRDTPSCHAPVPQLWTGEGRRMRGDAGSISWMHPRDPRSGPTAGSPPFPLGPPRAAWLLLPAGKATDPTDPCVTPLEELGHPKPPKPSPGTALPSRTLPSPACRGSQPRSPPALGSCCPREPRGKSVGMNQQRAGATGAARGEWKSRPEPRL